MSHQESPNKVPKNPSPQWVEEPFRLFFPLGLLAAVFGLLLWPLHYAGWWSVYPAIQHPRIMILGFGSAFVFGFLGTAWPRFVEAPPLRAWEMVTFGLLWLFAQVSYAVGQIARGDALMSSSLSLLFLLLVLRLFGKERDRPPVGFAVAAFSVGMAAVVLACWAAGVGKDSVWINTLYRLLVYQGFLLLPIMGVGSVMFGRIFPIDTPISTRRIWVSVLGCSAMVLCSFLLEAQGFVDGGNHLRFAGVLFWTAGTVPAVLSRRASGTRPWALRMGLILLLAGFLVRGYWPDPRWAFGFEHFLFLGGFSLLMLLVADRVAKGHSVGVDSVQPRSLRWRWIVWLMVLTALTRVTADLVPTTRVSHHIYAAITLIVIFVLWWLDNGRRLWKGGGED